jgi:hypothetical protein
VSVLLLHICPDEPFDRQKLFHVRWIVNCEIKLSKQSRLRIVLSRHEGRTIQLALPCCMICEVPCGTATRLSLPPRKRSFSTPIAPTHKVSGLCQ